MSKEKKLVPELRFPEFVGEWGNSTIGNLFDFRKGVALSKSDMSDEGDCCILYGELYTSYSEQIFKVKSKTSVKVPKVKLLIKYDILIPSSGETAEDIATSSCLHIDDVVPGGDLIILRYKADIFPPFYSYYISGYLKNSISKLAQGKTVVHLYSSSLSKLNVRVPCFKEQQKISSFLYLIDRMIELLEKKVELLEEQKRGLLQRIFSQEIRFKKEDGTEFEEWTSSKVGDLFDLITRGKVLSSKMIYNNRTEVYKYPVYSSQTLNNGHMGYYDDFLFEDCITWTTDGANAGDFNYRRGKFYCTNVCGVLISYKGFSGYAIADIINTVSTKYVSYVGNPKLMNNVVREIPINHPQNLIELDKISDFIKKFNCKISVEKKKLMKCKEFKNGLLQKMFI